MSRPTVVPFAGLNWRIAPEATWPDGRRLGLYLSTAVGINTNNSLTEFAAGPSISYRAMMLSPLLHVGHDVRLTQGEFAGQVWCNQSGADGNTPKCSGNPPSPSTERFWKASFALGLSVRTPSVFGSGGK